MNGLKRMSRIVAGSPIEAGTHRFLPSVMVTVTQAPQTEVLGASRLVHLRPISVVEQSPAGAKWHSIPDATGQILSVLAVTGLLVALISSLVILFKSWYATGLEGEYREGLERNADYE